MDYEKFDIDLRDCLFLGEGHNGIVYRLPDGNVIKIFKAEKHCRREYSILKKVEGSRHFPKAYSSLGNYIIREYVGGDCLKDYIKENGLSHNMAVGLIKLLDEFDRLGFTKLDIRCRDIYVLEDGFLMVIDPKCSYTKYRDFPKHLAKGLKKLGALEDFLEVANTEKPELYNEWIFKLKCAGLV
jgi:predicted Ser/Thr protein kinase